MAHSDDLGLVLPPRLAPIEVVIVPIWKSDEQKSQVMEASERVRKRLDGVARVRLDDRDTLNPGAKYYEWEGKGVPIRLEIGPKDVAKEQVMSVRRFAAESGARKAPIAEAELSTRLPEILANMQSELLQAALERRETNSYRNVSDYEEFKRIVGTGGGFIYTGHCGAEDCETRVKDDTKATIRVIPDADFRSDQTPDRCICGGASEHEVLWARAY